MANHPRRYVQHGCGAEPLACTTGAANRTLRDDLLGTALVASGYSCLMGTWSDAAVAKAQNVAGVIPSGLSIELMAAERISRFKIRLVGHVNMKIPAAGLQGLVCDSR